MKRIVTLAVYCVLGLSGPSTLATQRIWDGSSDCSKMGDYCPGNALCVDSKCVSDYGAEVSASGCLCCECEACVCEKRPECCSPDGYWDEECVALCGGECGGYALDLDKLDCEGKQCGWDGCYGSCGTCGPGLVCTDGVCEPCVPGCEGKDCGPDGCGGICGWCDYWNGEYCLDTLIPSIPMPKCYRAASIMVSHKGCCLSDSVVEKPGAETTCAEGYSCRWGRSLYWDENNIGEYGCFFAEPSRCPPEFDLLNCLNPDTWVFECCKEAPYVEYPSECDLTPQMYCGPAWECGPDGVGGACGTCEYDERCITFGCFQCVRDCNDKLCGDDGCGGSCGGCGTGEACIAGQCVLESGCGHIGDRGCCAGNRLVECLNGKLWEIDCNPFKGTELENVAPHCMWRKESAPEGYLKSDEWTMGRYDDSTVARYECGTVNEYSTHLVEEDPSAEHPRECDFTPCTRNCQGRSCGDDGCGGICGGCGDHRDCVDHQCVDRIPEPDLDVIEPADIGDSGEPEVVDPSDAVDSDVAVTDALHDNMTPDLPRDLGHEVDATPDAHHDTAGQDDTGIEPKPSAGCGCSASSPAPTGPDGGVLLILLLCVTIVWRARSLGRSRL